MAKKKVAAATGAAPKKAAKKKAAGNKTTSRGTLDAVRAQQTQFEGDGFPEPPPKVVCDARDAFLEAKRAAAKAGEKKADKHERLVELMHEHNIDRIPLDGENKYFYLDASEKVKIGTVPKEKREKRKAAEKK